MKKHKHKQVQSESEYRITGCQSVIRGMYVGRNTTDEAARCILASNWNFRDPIGRMNKSEADVRGFLESVSQEIGLYSEMTSEGRRNLLKMICDAYLRAFAESKAA